MSRVVSFALFFIVFLTVYAAMHIYVFYRFSGLFGLKRNWVFFSVLAGFIILFPVAGLIEHYTSNLASRILYMVASTWLGVVFLGLCAIVVFELVNLAFHPSPALSGMVLLAVVGSLSLFAVINALFVSVNTLVVPVNGLDSDLTLVQISDVHVGTVHNSGYISKLVEKINDINPDMVLITGDLIDGTGSVTDHTVSAIRMLKPRAFFTTGNHEQYVGVEKVASLVESAGIEVLRNEVVEYKGLQIVGIDNPGDTFGDSNRVLASLKLDSSKPSVLMFHPPLGLADSAAAGIDLQLSGHTHNGQIFPFNLIARMFYPRINGLYKYNNTSLYVSPGTGTWGPPMRLGSRSEITLIKLVPA